MLTQDKIQALLDHGMRQCDIADNSITLIGHKVSRQYVNIVANLEEYKARMRTPKLRRYFNEKNRRLRKKNKAIDNRNEKD